MPEVYDKLGYLMAEVDNDLYRKFLSEIISDAKPLAHALIDYDIKERVALSEYIIARLCEVDSGYLEGLVV